MTEKEKLEGFALEELLEITLAKAKGEPIKNEVPVLELLERVKQQLKDKLLCIEQGCLFSSHKRSYHLMHQGGRTPCSEVIEELLNLDRMISGLPPLLFDGRAPSSLPNYGLGRSV